MIISHRGLNAYNQIVPESSLKAFEMYLSKNIPIEFDLYFHNNEILITHNFPEIYQNNKINNKITKYQNIKMLSDIFSLIRKYKIKDNALHLKGKFQEKKYLNLLIKEINKNLDLLNYFFIFDVTIETAKYLKSQIPAVKLAPSVAHKYDVERYGKYVGNTLLPIEEVVKNKKIFDWVWLDEWDRKDANNKIKKLYTKETFEIFQKNNLKIAVVSPELHATSPDLLGKESHEDAQTKEKLFDRIKEIVDLHPDLICTDYIKI